MSEIELVQDFDDLFDAPVEKDNKPFAVEKVEHALWCEAKLSRAEDELQANTDLAEKLHKRIDEWLAKKNEAAARTVDTMMQLMRPWVEREVASGKRKSIDLLEHRIGIREGREHVEVTDEQAAIFALEASHPEAVAVKKSVLKTPVAALLKAGEKVDGGELKDGERSYFIEPLKEKK